MEQDCGRKGKAVERSAHEAGFFSARAASIGIELIEENAFATTVLGRF
jgi:hypothetical protein